jgi:hypothetical protein
MTTAIRTAAKKFLPERHFAYLQSVRSRNRQLQWLKDNYGLDFARQFCESNGSVVLHGPFAGMRYPAPAILSRHSVPRILGSYESELHGVIEAALRTNYDLVIDIGSAEGYYAVGFSLQGPAPVIAFESDPRELALCKKMARLNGVADRLSTRTWCDPEALQSLAAGKRCFILSDCEGYESTLFDDATVAALRTSDVLIETHGDSFDRLLPRFARTHGVETFIASERSASEYPELSCLAEDADLAVCEYRPAGQRWLLARSLEQLRSEI